MCGILGIAGGEPVARQIVDGLRLLEYRGYDSAGYAVVAPGSLELRKVAGAVAGLDALEAPPGCVGVGHTRWATHGPPTSTNAHPHADCTGRIAIVHNGIIENHRELAEKLVANGHTIRSDTDSEVLAHLIEEHNSGDLFAAVRAALAGVKGSYALAVVSADAPDRIVVARRKSPLLVGIAEDRCVVASDVSAILAHTRSVVFLDDDDMGVVTAQGLQLFDLHGAPKEFAPRTMSGEAGAALKGDYEHHMLKEIHEIPDALRALLHGRLGLLGHRFDIQGAITETELRAVKRIIVAACGTSHYAGLVGKSMIERVAGIPVEVHQASEFRYAPMLQEEGTLMILVSQSGETADTIEALRAAQANGARSLAAVNVPHCTLARQADSVFDLRAGPEVGVASTKTFVNMLGFFYLLGIHLGETRGAISATEAQRLAAQMRDLPVLAARVFDRADEIQRIGEEFFSDSDDAFFLGRQGSHGLAMEGALKLKEISYVHAEGYAAGELKHGPLALFVAGLPVTVLLPSNDPSSAAMLGNVAEVQARGGRVLGVVSELDTEAPQLLDSVLRIPATDAMFFPFPASIALYLLAYHAARKRGCPIDRPRNLAKSVTVE
jgi:glucosamine--fructose-6-phosphate aminotransferase (isomerizing)